MRLKRISPTPSVIKERTLRNVTNLTYGGEKTAITQLTPLH
ncbi:hypothetical protein OK016_12360 [Vibrio chagasii]|nr:hypothetical protein [Vibrio chagasii]